MPILQITVEAVQTGNVEINYDLRRMLMKNLAKMHDDMLDYEADIVNNTELLTIKRALMYKHQDAEILKEVIPVLNDIIQDVQRYREWIQTQN